MTVTSENKVAWSSVLDRGREIMAQYTTRITVRQLFYRLVAELVLPNTPYHYKKLSLYTAKARRDGTFPEFVDEGREILGTTGDRSPASALRILAATYSRDWTEGQSVSIYLGVEKRGMVNQLSTWFRGRASILGLGGYASQSYCDQIRRDVARQRRPAVLIYSGDHDPAGWDIDRDLVARTGCWTSVTRIALTPALIDRYQLPSAVDNDPLTAEKVRRDTRAEAFVERFGRITQVELDALPLDVLRQLYQDAFDAFWDDAIYQDVLAREADERRRLQQLAQQWD